MERMGIKSIILIYGVVFAAFSIYLVSASPPSFSGTTFNGDEARKLHIVTALIDQLKSNLSGFSNNVWQTLATLMLAIGLLLGSDKLKEMVSAKPNYVSRIQVAVIMLYCVHALAYYKYAQLNGTLMSRLESVAGSLDYYLGFRITWEQVTLNLLFDTVLFMLLAYTFHHLGPKQERQ